MDVRDISDAHVHVKTMNGSVNLDNIKKCARRGRLVERQKSPLNG